jgi:hypothetical protein
MDVAISALVGVITVTYNRHKKFEALKQENESFCQSILAVHDVLRGIQGENLTSELKRPLDVIEQGIKLGQEVMESCLKRGSRLGVALFSKTYISKLNTVGNKIDRGLSMLSASCVSIQTGRIDGAK